MPSLIGICGNIGVGKTTVAKMIQDTYPSSVILPFAGEVKRELHTLLTSYRKGHFFSYTRNMLYGTQEDKNLVFFVPHSLFTDAACHGIDLNLIGDAQLISGQVWYATTGRKLLQWYGTDYRRKLNPNYWTNKWLFHYNALKDSNHIIVDDIRFPNETALVDSLNGTIIKIERKTIYDLAHKSESLVDSLPYDYSIDNNFDLRQLADSVSTISNTIFQGDSHDSRTGA